MTVKGTVNLHQYHQYRLQDFATPPIALPLELA